MTNLVAKIKTKSNYKNLNGKQIKIVQFLGTIVFCEFEFEGQKIRADFNLSEITSIKEIK